MTKPLYYLNDVKTHVNCVDDLMNVLALVLQTRKPDPRLFESVIQAAQERLRLSKHSITEVLAQWHTLEPSKEKPEPIITLLKANERPMAPDKRYLCT